MDELTLRMWEASLMDDYNLAIHLIYRGAKVNEPKETHLDRKTTLLHHAAAKGDIQWMRLLINHGANYNALDSMQQTPLHLAVMYGDRPDVVELLINEGAAVDARNVHQWTPLHMAVVNGWSQSLEKLIAKGASIEAVDANGWSALHLVIVSQNLRMIKMLISHKINVDAKDNNGTTPLLVHLAVENCNTEITRLLLDNGADVNTKSLIANFPLSIAARKGCTESLYLLLKRGARVNEASNTGETALHVAYQTGRADMASLLVEFGADINARNCEGKTPFELLPKSSSKSSEWAAQIIIKEAVKREALAGQPFCGGYQQMVQSCESYLKYDQECRDEVTRMRSKKIEIEDSAVSFFYIFSKDEDKLAALVRNEKIVTEFEASYFPSFKIYAIDLIAKFKRAKKRANFLTCVEDCLVDVLGDMVPATIVRKIAAYVKCADTIEN